MILVDSSVWIDYFADRETPQTRVLDCVWQTEIVAIGDLMLAEVLQGCRSERAFRDLKNDLLGFEKILICDHHLAIEAARNYRALREHGITPRKTIDTLIATRCILDNIPLLFSDRDFDPFVTHLGLRSALAELGAN